jgi:prevent-host-death family protein
MPTTSDSVNIYDAKTRLSQLVARAESGEHVTISRNGRPVAMLVPYIPERRDRLPGVWAGRVRISDDFDELSESEDADWYGV